MADAVVNYLRQSLPQEIAELTEPYLRRLEHGNYESLLNDPHARLLFGHVEDEKLSTINFEDFPTWSDYIFQRLGSSMADRSISALGKQIMFWCIGYAALLAFLQASVTGPPLAFDSAKLLFPVEVAGNKQRTADFRRVLLDTLWVDGIAGYRLTPNVELLCLADAIMTAPPVLKNVSAARWVKARIAFVQQRLLSEVSPSLQNVIYDDLELLEPDVMTASNTSDANNHIREEFLLERSTIHTHHGLDKLARVDLEKVKELRRFEFKLTGLMGKRTKYQQDDLSQMVVLARSQETSQLTLHGSGTAERINEGPKNVDLQDDTLLESIAFSRQADGSSNIRDDDVPASLASLDPSSQPLLQPLDSAVLLSLASSITNTSPQDGLTREETLPYATRVLEGGSSNWQVYTQALLVRSRIEGYRARTTERGLLQLQALVDQVIADTTGQASASEGIEQSATFLPRTKDAENAPVSDRLRYIFQLASPTRWELAAELAARWVQLGGLRSALDIYERLEMWAEAALCWAATEREDKARNMVRRQLFEATNGEAGREIDAVDETWNGPTRDPQPSDAPRLYCILGDIDSSPEMYEKAWQVSNQRYGRAQRSLGRYYLASKDFVKAADAYAKSLKANQLNKGSWFALGCTLLELGQFEKAVEAFSRCVQLDDTDAEAWSNLAAALLRREPDVHEEPNDAHSLADDEDESVSARPRKDAKAVIKQNRQDALNALKRAAALKHDSYQIWQNVLIVAASTVPPDYQSILAAQKRIIDLRGSTEGEKCIDFEILEALLQHIIAIEDKFDPSQPGLARMVVKFMDESIVPLITNSAPLWQLVSKLALWRNRPGSTLDAEEKAWRAITSQPGWETESEARWNEVVEATVRLCDSYESLGPRERTEGLAAGAGELVAKDWKFKAKSGIRGVMGRGKGSWDGTEGWERLKEAMEGLKG